MKRHGLAALMVLWLGLLCSTTFAATHDGVRLEADGKIIDIDIGHLVPCVIDWNQDGKKDLIVGQFSRGRIRLYLNRGTDSAPVFKDFKYLHAGSKEIRLPAG